jgi:hypothetical protein
MKNTKRWLKNWNLKQRSDKKLIVHEFARCIFRNKIKQTLHARI